MHMEFIMKSIVYVTLSVISFVNHVPYVSNVDNKLCVCVLSLREAGAKHLLLHQWSHILWSSSLQPWCYSKVVLSCWWILNLKIPWHHVRKEDSRENVPTILDPYKRWYFKPWRWRFLNLTLSLVPNCLDSKPGWVLRGLCKYSFGGCEQKLSLTLSGSKDTVRPSRKPLLRH